MENRNSSVWFLILSGIVISLALTALIAWTAPSLSQFHTIGVTKPFAYPWRLSDPSWISHASAWFLYFLHNLFVWALIFYAKRQKPGYSEKLRWFNFAMIGVNLSFIGLHLLQTHLWYDGLAQDVAEISALGSVALMLIVIMIHETPRRGLILGKKVLFHKRFLEVVKDYHGYFFSWAIIYTFWYHPTEGTLGHLLGFFYMFMLFVQSSLVFNRAHLNKWWTLLLEVFVLFHGVAVAVFQGNALWPMFAFGFGAMFFLVQMYGLGFSTWTKRILWVGFIAVSLVVYAELHRLPKIHEIVRIPMLDYLMIGVVYALFWLGLGISKLFSKKVF